MTTVISENGQRLVFTRSKQVIFRIKDTLKLGQKIWSFEIHKILSNFATKWWRPSLEPRSVAVVMRGYANFIHDLKIIIVEVYLKYSVLIIEDFRIISRKKSIIHVFLSKFPISGRSDLSAMFLDRLGSDWSGLLDSQNIQLHLSEVLHVFTVFQSVEGNFKSTSSKLYVFS